MDNEKNYSTLPFQLMTSSYLSELKLFDKITKKPEFKNILNCILDYEKCLGSLVSSNDVVEDIRKITSANGILYKKKQSKEIKKRLNIAHVVACCVLLQDARVGKNTLVNESVTPFAQKYLSNIDATNTVMISELSSKINHMDAVRTIHILRLLGFLKRESKDICQLGMGAASGVNDIQYCHALPNVVIDESTNDTVVFGTLYQTPAHIIVSDLDVRFTELYAKHTNDPESPMEGYIMDTIELLEYLATKNIRKRNFITMLRIEPSMLKDVGKFFRYLSQVIDDGCDFVLSIGSGDNVGAYQHRIDVIMEMHKALLSASLEPVIIKLHDEGSIEKQITSIQFGSSIASSYEILYCKLQVEKLKKRFYKT